MERVEDSRVLIYYESDEVREWTNFGERKIQKIESLSAQPTLSSESEEDPPESPRGKKRIRTGNSTSTPRAKLRKHDKLTKVQLVHETKTVRRHLSKLTEAAEQEAKEAGRDKTRDKLRETELDRMTDLDSTLRGHEEELEDLEEGEEDERKRGRLLAKLKSFEEILREKN